jgi:hypothetical protein
MAKIKFRRDTAANWLSANPILAQGEPGFAYDINEFRIGDGVTPWANLTSVGGSEDLLADETAAREAADAAQGNALVNETASRQAADASIQANIDALEQSLAPVAFSGAYSDLTGTPTGTASTAYVDAAVAGIVNSAPEALNTLNEIAVALGNDANFATALATQ